MKNHRRLNYLMEEAGRIASENVDLSIGGPFGALIVLKDKIIGTGTNRVTIDNDPTAHAEIVRPDSFGKSPYVSGKPR